MAHLLARIHIEDLGAPVASGGDEATIVAETHTAHHTLMRQVVHEIHVEPTVHTRVEDSVPVVTLALEVRWELVRLKLRQLIPDLLELRVSILEVRRDLLVLVGWRRRAGDIRRPWVRVRLSLLRRSRAREHRWRTAARLSWARRRRLRWCAWSIA